MIIDSWDVVSSLLEESIDKDFTIMFEYNRMEIKLARIEVENRWVINNLTNALKSGR